MCAWPCVHCHAYGLLLFHKYACQPDEALGRPNAQALDDNGSFAMQLECDTQEEISEDVQVATKLQASA